MSVSLCVCARMVVKSTSTPKNRVLAVGIHFGNKVYQASTVLCRSR